MMISPNDRAVFTEELRNRRGRPRGINTKVSTGLYLSASLYELYYEQAKQRRCSINAVLCDALEQALKHRAPGY